MAGIRTIIGSREYTAEDTYLFEETGFLSRLR